MWYFVVFSVILMMANGENSESQNVDIDLYLNFERGRPVDMEVSQGDEFYCKLVDPKGRKFYDGFSRCRLTLDRVGSEHEGLWKMFIGYSGRVTAVEEIISVTVTEPEPKTDIVKTEVIETSPGVKMTCSLPIDYKIRGCQFRGPQGQVLLASGTYEEKFNGTSYKSALEDSECSVTIVDPKEADIGRWRCAMDAENGTYYEFMEVFISIPDAHYVSMNPTIEPRFLRVISGLENEAVTLSCSINARIKYCDFRDKNGTVFSVFPGMKSSTVEYVGLGFDAGECGIKMILPPSHDLHTWSCNIGLVENTNEYNTVFLIYIQEYLQVVHYQRTQGIITISGITYNGETPEYCRFVRSDGLSFTTENAPSNYNGLMSRGTCEITTYNPTALDSQPWTIFAKLRHLNWEIVKQTSGLYSPEAEPPFFARSGRPVFLYLILGVLMLSFVVSIALTPKKSRKWVSNRATAVRQSLRLRKTPLTGNEPSAPAQPPPYAQLA